MGAASYQIGDKVEIIELERPGRVRSIWITECGMQIEVSYFNNGEAKKVYFFEDEIRHAP